MLWPDRPTRLVPMDLPSGPASAAPSDGWHRYTTATASTSAQPSAAIYGTDLPSEAELRLLGSVDGKRILDLGCGVGVNAVVFAQQGAKVIAVDPSAALLGEARERADTAGVKVELHQAELADLAFLRSDSVDGAVSVMALAAADDLARVFRQVHRVLKPEAPFICTFPHPAHAMFDRGSVDPLHATLPYDQTMPRVWHLDDDEVVDHPRTVSEIFTTLHRSSFGVDQLLEPLTPNAGGQSAQRELAEMVPTTLVVRARKQGN